MESQSWRFIPTQWITCCIRIFKYKFTNLFGNIKIDIPTYAFKEKTNGIDTWKNDINKYFLSRILSLSNTYILPTVKCTQGCFDFWDKVGYLPIDIVFKIYLQKVLVKIHDDKNNLHLNKHVTSVR